MPIPEETVNNWVDALTIRTFNEELKSVFPFIYRLVDQPKSMGYADLVDEGKDDICPDCEKTPCECVEEDLEEHDGLPYCMFCFEEILDRCSTDTGEER
jgi:hypothetical protein